RVENFVLLHLIECLLLLEGGSDRFARAFQHFDVGANVVETGDRTVPRNDLNVCRQLGNGFFHAVDHPIDAAAGRDVDEREPVSDEVIAHVNDVGFGEIDDGVTISVAGGKVQCANVLAIDMDGYVVIKGDDR